MESHNEENKTNPPRQNYTKWLGLIGATMMFCSERLPTVWGNMTVYVTSYFYQKHGNTSVASTWALSACNIGGVLGSITVANLIGRVGRKKLVVLSVLGSNASLLSMYFTLEYNCATLIFLAFGIVGFCSGINGPVIFKIIAEISGSSKGRYISIACSGWNFGPAVTNFFVGFYMNPENIPPLFIVDRMLLFNDRDLIDKVPMLIMSLGIAYLLCQLTGYCLLSLSLFLISPKTTTRSDEKQKIVGLSKMSSKTIFENSEVIKKKEQNLETVPLKSAKMRGCAAITLESADKQGFTILKTLKYVPFYAMTFSFGVGVFVSILLNGYYKIFGLMHTVDDHLLTILGTLHPLIGGLSRIAWGFILDKFRIKSCLVSLYTFIGLTVMAMYFAPYIDIKLYFFVTLLVSAGANSVFPSFVIVTLVYFGVKDFCKTYPMLKVSRVFFAFIISPLFDGLFMTFGWFGPFSCVSFFATVALILIFLILPDVSSDKNNSKGFK